MLRVVLTEVADRRPRCRKALVVLDIRSSPKLLLGSPSLISHSVTAYPSECCLPEFESLVSGFSTPLPLPGPCRLLDHALGILLAHYPCPKG
jgi:hypothetical protein